MKMGQGHLKYYVWWIDISNMLTLQIKQTRELEIGTNLWKNIHVYS